MTQEALREQYKDRILERLKQPGRRSRSRNVLKFFYHYPGRWFKKHELYGYLGRPESPFFVGQNFDRRLREWTDEGFLMVREVEGGKDNIREWGIP